MYFTIVKKTEWGEKKHVISNNRDSIFIHKNRHKNTVRDHVLLWYNVLRPKATANIVTLQTGCLQNQAGHCQATYALVHYGNLSLGKTFTSLRRLCSTLFSQTERSRTPHWLSNSAASTLTICNSLVLKGTSRTLKHGLTVVGKSWEGMGMTQRPS